MPDEYGNGSDGPCSTSSSTDPADADLFLVAEVFEPSGELVGALNVPRHADDYAIDVIMRLGLYSAVRVPHRPFLEPCE